jgi:membrane protein
MATIEARTIDLVRPRGPARVLSTAAAHFSGHDADLLGAAIAFFTTLSIAPLLTVAAAVAGVIFGQEAARSKLVEELSPVADPTLVAAVGPLLTDAALDTSRWWKVGFGLVVAGWGASRIFVHLQEALNQVWCVRPRRTAGMRARVRAVLRKRAGSFVLVLSVGGVLFGSLALDWGVDIARHLVGTWWLASRILDLSVAAATTLGMAGFLTLTYQDLPDVELEWRDVWVGAVVAAALIAGGGRLMGLYLTHFAARSVTGAAGGVVVVLLWAYFAAKVILFGAALTRSWTEHRRGPPRPEPHAERIDECLQNVTATPGRPPSVHGAPREDAPAPS